MPRTADKFAMFVQLAEAQPENKYTDAQLAELMVEHFPNFAGPHMIPGYRRAYNNGSKPGHEAPAVKMVAYDAEGNAIPEGKRMSDEAKAAKKAKKAAAAPKAPKAPKAPAATPEDDADAAAFAKEVAAGKARAAKAKAQKAKPAAPAPVVKKLVIKKK